MTEAKARTPFAFFGTTESRALTQTKAYRIKNRRVSRTSPARLPDHRNHPRLLNQLIVGNERDAFSKRSG